PAALWELTRPFNQHRQSPADETAEIGAAQLAFQFSQSLATVAFRWRRDVIAHLRRWRSLSRAERKNVNLREATLAAGPQGGLKIGVRFTWKADDDVGRNCRIIERL